jgi:hypothetical protein
LENCERIEKAGIGVASTWQKAIKRNELYSRNFPALTFFPMKKLLPLVIALAFSANARAQTNLLPNGDFTDRTNPLAGWRVDFPYEPWYVKNIGYVKIAADKKSKTGGPCVEIDLPPGVAGNEGGKIESAFVKCEPGATYIAEVDVMTWDFGAKIHAEAWRTDPRPTDKPDKLRVPPRNGMPGLIMVYRRQFRDPPGGGKTWTTLKQEITIPKSVKVNIKGETVGESGWQEVPPEWMSLKIYIFAATPNGGKSYIGPVRLYKK